MQRSLGHLGESDIRLLRVFVALVEAGGLARAQGSLNLSLSTMSGYLTQLETRLGANLCVRGRRGFNYRGGKGGVCRGQVASGR